MSDCCPKCGGGMYQSGKYTEDGKDRREYTCRVCGHTVDKDRGKALWAILNDDHENVQAASKLSVGDAIVLAESDLANGLSAGVEGQVVNIDIVRGTVDFEIANPFRTVRVEARLVKKICR